MSGNKSIAKNVQVFKPETSDEAIKRALKEKKQRDKGTKIAIYAYTIYGKLVGSYLTIADASKELSIAKQTINDRVDIQFGAFRGLMFTSSPIEYEVNNEVRIEVLKDRYFMKLEEKYAAKAQLLGDYDVAIERSEIEEKIKTEFDNTAFMLFYYSGLDTKIAPYIKVLHKDFRTYINIGYRQKIVDMVAEYRVGKRLAIIYEEAYNILQEGLRLNVLEKRYNIIHRDAIIYKQDELENDYTVFASADTLQELAEWGGDERIYGTPEEIEKIMNGEEKSIVRDRYIYLSKDMNFQKFTHLTRFTRRLMLKYLNHQYQ